MDEARERTWGCEHGVHQRELERWRGAAAQVLADLEDGARQPLACKSTGINVRTLQPWKSGSGLHARYRRPRPERPTTTDALTDEERARTLTVANEPRFADQPPARLVPALADEGAYIASESCFQRVLHEHGQNAHRGRAPQPTRTPTTHVANAPGQVWCWDMTHLPEQIQGRRLYLYLIMDLFSSMIVACEIHEFDDAKRAACPLKRTALTEGIHAMADKPVLQDDNSGTIKATAVLAMLHWLGIMPSYPRPRVSDNNAFVGLLFETTKYRQHEFPVRGFATLEDARQWRPDFVRWYNFEQRHSALRYVTRAQRHAGEDIAVLAARHQTYLKARERHPARWPDNRRDWTSVSPSPVTLNPERDAVNRDPVHPKNMDRLVA
ncbi:Integrase core domain protein [Tepidimonas taiwanensis]|uniref:Integrase core domain protein n=2 Tax=Tepidimonas taiwanensis TaxID=307486 RepID=A0A554WXA2_9BURK|nr:Integrase core domain protein [Tepidimonas taiwanensis]